MSSCTAATIWPPLAVVQPTFSAAEQGCRAVAGDDVADEHGGVQAVGIDGQRIVLVHSQGVALQIRSQPVGSGGPIVTCAGPRSSRSSQDQRCDARPGRG
jgi:hypothetical protein